MWFKNLCLYRLAEPFGLEPDDLQEKLAAAAFRPCASTEMSAQGWVPPLGGDESPLVHSANGCHMLCLREESRLLPASVIRESLEERVEELERKESRQLGRRERSRLKEELTFELMPRAFTRSKRTYAYLDPRGGWLVIDAGTWKEAEALTELLRGCIGSLPVRVPQSAESPQAVMTRWLARDQVPADLTLGEEAVFEDPRTEGAEVRVKRQDLLSNEINAHIEAGKRIRRLAVTWDERMSCVLDADMAVKRLRFLDVVQEGSGDREPESAAERFDADFAIMALELGRFIPRLLELFGGEQREAG